MFFVNQPVQPKKRRKTFPVFFAICVSKWPVNFVKHGVDILNLSVSVCLNKFKHLTPMATLLSIKMQSRMAKKMEIRGREGGGGSWV